MFHPLPEEHATDNINGLFDPILLVDRGQGRERPAAGRPLFGSWRRPQHGHRYDPRPRPRRPGHLHPVGGRARRHQHAADVRERKHPRHAAVIPRQRAGAVCPETARI